MWTGFLGCCGNRSRSCDSVTFFVPFSSLAPIWSHITSTLGPQFAVDITLVAGVLILDRNFANIFVASLTQISTAFIIDNSDVPQP